MKRRLNITFIVFALAAIVLAALLSALVCNEIIRTEVMKGLESDCILIRDSGMYKDGRITVNNKYDNLRITVISRDGTVISDNYSDPEKMDNHSSRPEVKEALKSGSGRSIRRSATLNLDTFYYAVYIKDKGVIIRAAKESGNVYNFISRLIPFICVASVLFIIISVLVSYFLSRSLLRPVEYLAARLENLNINNEEPEQVKNGENSGENTIYRISGAGMNKEPDDMEADPEGRRFAVMYPEMQPFVDTIVKQHRDIVRNSHMRQEFTANVSHELKTPLTAITGYAQLIENGMTSPKETVKFSEKIDRNASRLLKLIEDIIRLSELDSSENVPDLESVDLQDTAKSVTDSLKLNASKHGVSLMLTSEKTEIMADKMMMEEVMYNLIDNAIRYNNPGGHVDIRLENRSDSAVFIVKDDGIGISQENQKRIFERFYRVDKSRSKRTGGTGLGLAIVKHIVEKSGADLDLQSAPGKGTCITVTFPKKPSA